MSPEDQVERAQRREYALACPELAKADMRPFWRGSAFTLAAVRCGARHVTRSKTCYTWSDFQSRGQAHEAPRAD
jgi:hypothetical protein